MSLGLLFCGGVPRLKCATSSGSGVRAIEIFWPERPMASWMYIYTYTYNYMCPIQSDCMYVLDVCNTIICVNCITHIFTLF